MTLYIQKYTDKAIVIRGDTKERKDDIKKIPGYKFGYYAGEPGWMFPVKMESLVRSTLGITSEYVDGPKRVVKDMADTTSADIVETKTDTTKTVAPRPYGALRGSPIIEENELEERVKMLEEKLAKLQEKFELLVLTTKNV